MTTTTPDSRAIALREPKPIIPALASFYSHTRELAWLIVRITAGGMLLIHGIVKTTVVMDKGLAAWAGGFAAGGLARRGIEPAVPLAYAVIAIETIGALLVVLGLFTRLAAAAAAIEFAVITFVAHWGNGFSFSSSGGGWEYPLFWGLILFAIALRGGGPYSLDRKLGWEL
jgi:putative oxidoreductase